MLPKHNFNGLLSGRPAGSRMVVQPWTGSDAPPGRCGGKEPDTDNRMSKQRQISVHRDYWPHHISSRFCTVRVCMIIAPIEQTYEQRLHPSHRSASIVTCRSSSRRHDIPHLGRKQHNGRMMCIVREIPGSYTFTHPERKLRALPCGGVYGL